MVTIAYYGFLFFVTWGVAVTINITAAAVYNTDMVLAQVRCL